MATIALRVLWHLSPRIIIVPAPVVTISVQDLSSSIKDIEDEPANLSYPRLVKTSGGEALSGSTSVGFTVELQDARVLFQQRTSSLVSSTVTTANAFGNILIDSNATYITDGVMTGDVIANITDLSISTVINVESENRLTLFPLENGTDNDFDFGDTYKIWASVEFEVSGGNLVAIDSLGDPLAPLAPSAFAYSVRTASSSATLINGGGGGGLTTTQDLYLSQIHGQVDRAVHLDTEAGAGGNGYQQTPWNDLSDAIDDAEALNLKRLHIVSDATLDRQLKNFEILGNGLPIIDLNGQNIDNSIFRIVGLTGSMTGTAQAIECAVDGLTGMAGVFYTVSINGTIGAAAGGNGLLLWETSPAIAGQPWTLDMGATGDVVVAIQNSTAGVTILNMNSAGDIMHFHGFQGLLTLDASCTAGTAVITGGAKLVDNSTGTTVNIAQLQTEMFSNATWEHADGTLVKDMTAGRWLIDEAANQMVFYKDDNTTEVIRFDLKDINGIAASTDIFERVKV